MKINEIKDRWVKIGKTSITIKDNDTGKTVGVVTNIKLFKDLQLNKKLTYFETLKKSGLWGSHMPLENVIIDTSGEMFFIYNTNGFDMLEKYSPDTYNKKMEIIKNASEYIYVIPVMF